MRPTFFEMRFLKLGLVFGHRGSPSFFFRTESLTDTVTHTQHSTLFFFFLSTQFFRIMVSLISPPSSSCNFQLRETRFFSTLLLPPRYSLTHSLIFRSLSPLINSVLFVTYHRSVQFQCENSKRKSLRCGATSASASPPPSTSLAKEPHKYFDHVIITVRGGDGGHGAVLNPRAKEEQDNKGKKGKGSLKRDFDGSLILPMGGHGGDVVIYADEAKDTLLEFHNKSRYHAKRGGNVDAMGVLNSMLRNGLAAPTLRIPVPVGLYALALCFSLKLYFLHSSFFIIAIVDTW